MNKNYRFYIYYTQTGGITKNKIFKKIHDGSYTNLSLFLDDLSEKNNDLYVLSENKNTYLHIAIRYSQYPVNIEIAKYLINNMNNLNITNNNNRTALHIAANKNVTEIYNLLISKGAKQDIVDKFNKKPINYLQNNKKPLSQLKTNTKNKINQLDENADIIISNLKKLIESKN